MKLLLANHSSYPRSDAAAARVSSHGGTAADTMPDRAAIAAAIHDQEAAGLDVVTDGQVCWEDPFARVLGGLDGVQLGGHVRYADTEVRYRQPWIVGPLRRRRPLLCEDFTVASRAARRQVKAVLPGPYTLARIATIESGPCRDVPALAHALSQLLAQEVADLVAAGARLIQIDEPAILTHPEDIRLLRQVMEPLWEARGPAQLAFATYGGNAAPMYAQLESVCADLLAFDIVSAPQLVDVVAATGSGKALALGVVDGASPQLESAPAIARQVATMLRRYTFDAVHLQPSCGLRAVPCAAARAKLDLLGAVGVLVQAGEPGGVQSE